LLEYTGREGKSRRNTSKGYSYWETIPTERLLLLGDYSSWNFFPIRRPFPLGDYSTEETVLVGRTFQLNGFAYAQVKKCWWLFEDRYRRSRCI
jgi:hypothetical protein